MRNGKELTSRQVLWHQSTEPRPWKLDLAFWNAAPPPGCLSQVPCPNITLFPSNNTQHSIGKKRKMVFQNSYLSDRTCNKCQPNWVLHLTTWFGSALNAASSNSGTWKKIIYSGLSFSYCSRNLPKVLPWGKFKHCGITSIIGYILLLSCLSSICTPMSTLKVNSPAIITSSNYLCNSEGPI